MSFEIVSDNLRFSSAIDLCRYNNSYVMARKNWNGNKNDSGEFVLRMYVIYVPGRTINVIPDTPYAKAGLHGEVVVHEHLDLKTPDGSVQPGWLASQADVFADDWVVYRVVE